MNLIRRCVRAVPILIRSKVVYHCANHNKQTHVWEQKYKMHAELFQNKQKFEKYMSDQRLLELIEEHYFLGDIVTIATLIAQQNSLYNRPLTDAQVAFLAFTYNLHQHEAAQIPELMEMISAHLLKRVTENNSTFASQQLAKSYLQQIYFLTGREYISLPLHREIITNLVCLLYLKFEIDEKSLTEINDSTLERLWRTLPYIPIQKGTQILHHFQQVLLKTIQYEAHRLKVQRDKGNMQRDVLNEGIERLSKLGELCIRVGNSRNQLVDIFSYLPTQFSNQSHFADWMVVLREFMIEPLLKRLDFKKMDIYHGKLSFSNKKYNKKRGYLSMESYCQSLLFLKVYNPRAFAYFFEAEDKPFLSKQEKSSSQKQPEQI